MSTPYLGEIMMFAGNFAPTGWALCNGQTMNISQNAALFALLGTTYGGNGTSTFALPDLRSRVPMHVGPGNVQGEMAGSQTVQLAVNNLPGHSHQALCTKNEGASPDPAGMVWASTGASRRYDAPSGTALAATAISNAGNAEPTPHNNLQPLLAVNFCIALVGIFPTRN
jgi:microcystin-dependent protein